MLRPSSRVGSQFVVNVVGSHVLVTSYSLNVNENPIIGGRSPIAAEVQVGVGSAGIPSGGRAVDADEGLCEPASSEATLRLNIKILNFPAPPDPAICKTPVARFGDIATDIALGSLISEVRKLEPLM